MQKTLKCRVKRSEIAPRPPPGGEATVTDKKLSSCLKKSAF